MRVCPITISYSLTVVPYSYFFLIAGSSVKIYATATGQVVSTLSCSSSGSTSSSSLSGDGHTDDITAAFINPRNAFQLMTASLDGRIKIWDYLEAALLSTIEIGEPITHMCAHEHVLDHVFVATSSQKRHKKHDGQYLISCDGRANCTSIQLLKSQRSSLRCTE